LHNVLNDARRIADDLAVAKKSAKTAAKDLVVKTVSVKIVAAGRLAVYIISPWATAAGK
jgi:hypothetical protein